MITPASLSEKGRQWYQRLHESGYADIQQSVFALHKQLSAEEVTWLMQQAEGLRIAAKKLPAWAEAPVLFPPKRALEQCSSETTARFKASLFAGKKLVDLTGGLGVDTWAFAHSFQEVIHVEQNSELSEMAGHNFAALQTSNIKTTCASAEQFLESLSAVDLLFIDPDRRPESHKRVFRFEDCVPDLLHLKEQMLQKAPLVVVKASPLIDLDYIVHSLPEASVVWVVAVQNECKELLILLERSKASASIKVKALNFMADATQELEATYPETALQNVPLSLPLRYLYEPNASLMKAGIWHALATQTELPKLHPNSHLYTSEKYYPAFPGRTFEINQVLPFKKDTLKSLRKLEKANISVRNFPFSAEELRNKTGLKDGGSHYLFATTDQMQQKIIIICQKPELTTSV